MTEPDAAAPQPDPTAGQPGPAPAAPGTAAPGAPAAPEAPAAPGTPPAPAKPAGGGTLLKVLIGVGIVIVVLGVAFFLLKDNPGNAEVGDCIAGQNPAEVVIVDCGDAEAKWQVVGKVEDKTEAEMQTACGEFPEAEQAFWQGEEKGKGFVLCMKPVK